VTATASAVTGRLAAVLLGAASVAWAAVPLRHTGLATTALSVSVICVWFGALRLALGWIPRPADEFLASAPMRAWMSFQDLLRTPPWEEAATAAVVWLEVLHRACPWHTAILGAALTAYLLATHLAESGASVRVMRPQARVLALGACLLAAAAGAAMLPGTAGESTSLLRVIAAVAVVAAAALVLP
jgi:hypothetical protein